MDLNRRFEEQVAVISGGASGIGLAIGQRLAAEGAKIVLFDLDAARLAEVAGDWAETAIVDVSDEAQVNAAMDDVIARHGRMDVMVNSAGIPGKTAVKIVDYDLESF